MGKKVDAFEEIRDEALKTAKKLKELHKDSGTYKTPVNTDLVKTTKAMFYEKTVEILRKVRKE